ncbi:MAG: alpha/beta hydrolase [Clostridiales bacterium]
MNEIQGKANNIDQQNPERLDIKEKFINIDGLDIHYYQGGAGYPVVFLHGWGSEGKIFAPVQKYLSQYFNTYSLDFPGFGHTPPPLSGWNIRDYADFAEKFCHKLALEKPILIGHSFGGRVSIILGARNFPHKMILVDSAGIRPARSAKYYLRVYSYKAAKKIFSWPLLRHYKEKVLTYWQKNNASSDYQQAKGILREIFVKVVNEDLKPDLPKIKAETLLVWGDKDTATPLADGQLMEKLIPGSGLVVLKNAGHYSFLDRLPQFLLILDSFLSQDKDQSQDKGEKTSE